MQALFDLRSNSFSPMGFRTLSILRLKSRIVLVLAAGLLFSFHVIAQAPLRAIVFMTAFGDRDDAVGLCRGVMEGVALRVRIFDITHEVTPFVISQGARHLRK